MAPKILAQTGSGGSFTGKLDSLGLQWSPENVLVRDVMGRPSMPSGNFFHPHLITSSYEEENPVSVTLLFVILKIC